jgi:preprotein translocase subunit YajC
MSLFISDAHAQAAGGASAAGGGFEMLIMLGVFGLIFYFMLYRPQAKRVKEHKNLVSSLSKGDEVLTQGGMVGKIAKVSDEKDFVELALNDTTNIVVQKSAISTVLPKATMKAI